MVEHFIGSYPEQTPAILSAEVTASKTHEDGSVRRRIHVVLDTLRQVAFEMELWAPSGAGPFPLLLTAPRFYRVRKREGWRVQRLMVQHVHRCKEAGTVFPGSWP